MRRLLFIPLLALPLLVLSCDEPAPTQPEADEFATAGPLFAAKPPPGFNLLTNCVESGGDYYCGDVSGGNPMFAPSVCPLQRGTFVYQYCRDNEFGNPSASSVCEAKQGRWKTIRRKKLGPACASQQAFSMPSPVVGFSVKYNTKGIRKCKEK